MLAYWHAYCFSSIKTYIYEVSTPNLEEIIEAGVDAALGRTETSQIGLVTSFDKDKHTVNVQPVAMKRIESEDGEFEYQKQPVIPNVPVWFFGSSDARVTFPLTKGSTVLLVHLSHSRTAWQFSSGAKPVEADERRHALTDCVAIPGGLTASMVSRASARVDNNGVIIHTPGKIYLGGGAVTSPVALKTDLETIKPAILAGLDAQIAALAVGLPATLVPHTAAVNLRADISANWPVCSAVTESE
jgi:hypothetical protein